jgi:hypothetical protein
VDREAALDVASSFCARAESPQQPATVIALIPAETTNSSLFESMASLRLPSGTHWRKSGTVT